MDSSIFFCICCNTAVFSYLLLCNFAWEIGTQLAKNDPLTQTRCLTTVLHPSLSRGYITVRAIYQTYGHQTMQLSLFLVILLITPLFLLLLLLLLFFVQLNSYFVVSFQLQLIYICLVQKIIQYDCKISGPLSRYHIMVSEVDSDEEISTNGNKEIC